MCNFAAFQVIGMGLGSLGGIMQGQQAQAAARAQASALEQQAAAERQAASFEIMQTQQRQDYARSAAITQVAASGVGLAGSPTEVIVGQAGRDQLELEAIQYGSQIRQNTLLDQAAVTRAQGRQALVAGHIQGARDVVSGLASLYNPANQVNLLENPFARRPQAAGYFR